MFFFKTNSMHLSNNFRDIVSYSDRGSAEDDPQCDFQYSSNWHAGSKGNLWSDTWWNNLKWIMTRKCKPGEFVGSVDKVCCHEEGAPEKSKEPCHIPWAHLEHLKVPKRWGETHNNLDGTSDIPIHQWERTPKMFCLRGKNSLTPQLHGEVYWQPWDARNKKTRSTLHWELPKRKFNCTEVEDGGHLDCNVNLSQEKFQRYENFFGRPGYHLFFSTFTSGKVKTAKEILHRPWLLSEVYRRALGLKLKKRAEPE